MKKEKNEKENKDEIKAIVFDIGGVLLENPLIGNFWKDRKGSKELRSKFGAGKLSKKVFIKKASKILDLSENNFLKEYGKAYFPIRKRGSVFKIYRALSMRKYLFSDTNPIHLKFIKKKYPELFRLANKAFLSSEIGSRKDELKSYNSLIKNLNLPPSQILLIDDNQEVLNLGKKLGIKTILFQNNKQLVKDLKKHNIQVTIICEAPSPLEDAIKMKKILWG